MPTRLTRTSTDSVAQDTPADYPRRVTTSPSGALAIGALRRLPVHALSRAAGAAASWHLPSLVRPHVCRAFARAVGADLEEVRDSLDSFGSLQDFFTRALREGARPIDPDPSALVAPCDGAWGEAGPIASGQLLQVKGRPYALADLLGDDATANSFEGGCFATFYLAPRDYHRFHAPCNGRVSRAVHLPGSLWPVNSIGLEGVPGLFAENERIVAFLRLGRDPAPDAPDALAIAAVGATMVGKVHVDFDTLTTNQGATKPRWRHYEHQPFLEKGHEWGRFEFGSTLVLAAAPGTVELDAQPPGTPLRLGTRIGRIEKSGEIAPAGETTP
jgi:phosphatidylserine decarboxylase